MKRLIALAVAIALALGAWIAAGPFVAMHRIESALQRNDMRSLDADIDFELVRSSLRSQVEDYVARQTGDGTGRFGALGTQLAGNVTGGIVDMLATPAGIGAVLQGRAVIQRFAGLAPRAETATGPQRAPADLVRDATYRFESASRFTATVRNADGVPIEFVFTRDGLRWRLTDIRLPIERLVHSLLG